MFKTRFMSDMTSLSFGCAMLDANSATSRLGFWCGLLRLELLLKLKFIY